MRECIEPNRVTGLIVISSFSSTRKKIQKKKPLKKSHPPRQVLCCVYTSNPFFFVYDLNSPPDSPLTCNVYKLKRNVYLDLRYHSQSWFCVTSLYCWWILFACCCFFKCLLWFIICTLLYIFVCRILFRLSCNYFLIKFFEK